MRAVLPDAADEDFIPSRGCLGLWIEADRGVVLDGDAGRLQQKRLGPLGIHWAGELGVDGGAVAHVDGHTHAGRRDGKLRFVHDLARLDRHLPLFVCVAVVLERADLRQYVVRDLVRIDVRGGPLILEDAPRLLRQLFHRGSAGARDGLVGSHNDALHRVDLVQWPERHHDRCGGAVRDRQDALMVGNVARVHFWHDEGHVRLHPPDATVVDHDGAGFRGRLANGTADLVGGRDEHEVYATKRARTDLFDLDLRLAERDLLSG